jgi:rhodanese-related sulfurtransferase
MKILKLILISILSIAFSGCLDDPAQSNVIDNLESSAELINYFEVNGDYVNSEAMPFVVTVDEVSNNLSDYLLFDLRSEEQFLVGHIENAVNVKHNNLVSFIESLDNSNSKQIVLISSTGEAAAYYNCLLRLLGFSNTFSMKHGMAMWNRDLSSSWLNSIRSYDDFGANIIKFNDVSYKKADHTELPKIIYSRKTLDITQKIRERVLPQFEIQFNEREVSNSSPLDDLFSNTSAGISFESLYQYINEADSTFNNIYVMCFGSYYLYRPVNYHMGEKNSHPPTTVWYNNSPDESVKSVNYLQTIPSDKVVAIYSNSGIESAYLTAYLRTIGYNAVSILFGANGFHYNTLLTRPQLWDFMFREDDIRNYPYVAGN